MEPVSLLPYGPIRIAGASWALWHETTARYDYADAPGECPICHGVGVVWQGWFTCDGICHAIAAVESGRVFLPAPLPREETPV